MEGTVIENPDQFPKPSEIHNALPNVEIEYRTAADLLPPSPPFDAHAKKLQAEIREKYLGPTAEGLETY